MRASFLLCLALTVACQDTTQYSVGVTAGETIALEADPIEHDWAATFERIAVVGASSSAGFGVVSPGGAAARLSDCLHAAIGQNNTIVLDEASEFLFLNPETLGAIQIKKAAGADPTLLVAVDFLFWFFYGDGDTTAERLARLETGLAHLEAFDCPVVVGDLPYMIEAAGGMIPWSMMPDAEGFQPANARIHAWVAAHPNVTLVSLDATHKLLNAGGTYSRGSFEWDTRARGALLQADHLHPNLAGTAAMAIEILNALAIHESATLENVAQGTLEGLVSKVDAELNRY
jgi:hypothetical protein